MEQLIAKKEACIKYANETYGEGFEKLGNGASISNEHKYSPRFDKCLTKRQYRDNGGTYLDPLSTTTIIDVVSETTLFSRNDDCESNIDRSRYTPQEFQDLCPSDWDVNKLWNALISTNS